MSGQGRSSSTPPPALTWLHLVSSESKLSGIDLPQWIDGQIQAYAGAGGDGSALTVSYNVKPVFNSAGGVVALNAPPMSGTAFLNAGYTYVRRFAAIPNLRETRWLIPLDSPAISSAAFSLYTPARLTAKFKRWAAQLITHTRLPLWYRDHLTIALPQPPPLELTIAKLFPGRDVRLALSSGAPEGARNRKASALAIDSRGKLLAFIKLARSPIARRILDHEAGVLPRLSHLPVPRLLLHVNIDGTVVLVQTPLAGKPAPLPLGPIHEKFLHSLQSQEMMSASETAMVVALANRLRAWPQLSEILEQTLAMLRSVSVPRTIVHGDFAPWNLRIHDGRISAFDWEYAEISGLPLIDRIHYGLQVGMMLRNWNVEQARRFLADFFDSRPLGLAKTAAAAIGVVYLLDALARLLAEGYSEDHEMILWHRGLLDAVAASAIGHAERVIAA